MSAFNVVRMRAKPGAIDELIAFYRDRDLGDMPGIEQLTVVRTGERDFCVIGQWTGMDALVAARPAMIATLDRYRGKLEELGPALGVTDPVSGEAVVQRIAPG
jgi:hypothetical protein